MVMARVLVIAGSSSISQSLVNRLSKSPVVEACHLAPRVNGSYALLVAEQAINTVVYAPQLQSQHRMMPHLAEATAVLQSAHAWAWPRLWCCRVRLSKGPLRTILDS
jgi:hypothetical protein